MPPPPVGLWPAHPPTYRPAHLPTRPHQKTVPPEKNEIYQTGPNLQVDFRYANFFLASDTPPPQPPAKDLWAIARVHKRRSAQKRSTKMGPSVAYKTRGTFVSQTRDAKLPVGGTLTVAKQ